MRNEDLLHALGGVSDDLVMDAAPAGEKKKSRWPRWAAAAACVCAAAVGAWTLAPQAEPTVWSPDVDTPPGVCVPPSPAGPVDAPPVVSVPTSDTYANLDELLAYLSGHDDHGARNQDKSGAGGDTVRSAAGYTAVVWEDYIYHIVHEGGERGVRISRLVEQFPEQESPEDVVPAPLFRHGNALADVDAELLFQWENCLAAVGRRTEELDLNAPSWVWVKLYDLSDPENPAFLREFSLLGGLTGCWQDGKDLYLLTGDGICACGWSRLSSPEDYYPQLERDGQPVSWREEEFAILGEPLRVEYTAAVRIDLIMGEVNEKRAFYGDIDGVFHGEGWLALVTEGSSENRATLPVAYSFSHGFYCDGKLDAAELLGLSGTVELSGGARPDGQYPELVSVSREGDVLRAVGSVRESKDGSYTSSLLAAALDLTTGERGSALLPVERFFHIGDLLWEEDRAVLFASTLNAPDGEDRLCLARFDGTQAAWTDSGLTCDRVNGVDMMYSYGSPLGWLETVIPLGNGRYLRYNGTPDGLDLYDLSGDTPVLVRRSPGDLEEGRFEFQWEVYNENTVGILVVLPNAKGEYRNVTFAWDVYRVEEDGLELLDRELVTGGELTALEYRGGRWLAEWGGNLTAVDRHE